MDSDIRVIKERQVRASIDEAVKYWMSGWFNDAKLIVRQLSEEGVHDADGRFTAACERARGIPSEPIGKARPDDDQKS